MSKSITIDTVWYEILSDYAASHYMTKKDTLTMLLDISIGRKNTFNDWLNSDKELIYLSTVS